MKILKLACTMLAGVAVSAISSGLAWAQEPVHGGVLIVGAETELGTRDPVVSESGAAARVNWLTFEGLVGYDFKTDTEGAPPQIVPVLAESWERSEDGLTYTFQLRQNVTFHDGTPFNADAVVFNVRRVIDPEFEYYFARGSGIPENRYLHVTKVEALDDSTVQFTLSEPNAFFIAQLAEAATPGLPAIVSPSSVEKNGNEAASNDPAGTGPFMVAEQARGQYLRLVRNPNYWNAPYPYLDELIFRELPDSTTRVNALMAGEVDMIIGVPPDDVQALIDDGFNVPMSNLPHIWYLSFNVENEAFKDVRVRRAVSMAIDKKGMAEDLLQGTAKPVFSMVSQTSASFDQTWEDPYPYDVEQAKSLMAEAGYGDGFDTVFEISTSGSGQIIPVPMAEWIQRDLAQIGIRATLNTFEWNTYMGRWVSGMEPQVGINQMSWGSNSDFWLRLPFASSSFANTGHVNDPELDSLLASMVGAQTDAERHEYARRVAVHNFEQAYHLPIVGDQGAIALAPKVKGFVRAADWIEDYANIWIEE